MAQPTANTNSISVNVGTTAIGGNIIVSAVNICGQSNPRLLPVSVGNFAFANIQGLTGTDTYSLHLGYSATDSGHYDGRLQVSAVPEPENRRA